MGWEVERVLVDRGWRYWVGVDRIFLDGACKKGDGALLLDKSRQGRL